MDFHCSYIQNETAYIEFNERTIKAQLQDYFNNQEFLELRLTDLPSSCSHYNLLKIARKT